MYLLVPDSAQLSSITYWLLGGLYNANYGQLRAAIPVVAVEAMVLYFLRWKILILRNGDLDAQIHGVNAKRTKLILTFSRIYALFYHIYTLK